MVGNVRDFPSSFRTIFVEPLSAPLGKMFDDLSENIKHVVQLLTRWRVLWNFRFTTTKWNNV